MKLMRAPRTAPMITTLLAQYSSTLYLGKSEFFMILGTSDVHGAIDLGRRACEDSI